MVSRCYLCGGRTERRLVTAENWWGEELALVEGVPAWVCQDCGEQYFDATTSRQLDRLRAAPPSARKTVAVPVYAFADAASQIETTLFGRVPGPRAVNVRCDGMMLWVDAEDGRQLGVPLARFPRLADATEEQRTNWELVGRGIGIHWSDVDEDISVARLVGAATDQP